MASSTSSTTAGGFMVVTHVHPLTTQAQAAGPMHYGQQQPGPQQSLGSQRFSKGRPMALGTVQIVIGMMTLLFGIAMVVNADTLGIYSGFFVWGASMYIAAGSLTVAAAKNMKPCLVNGALGCCVVAAIFAFTAIILYSMDAAGVLVYCRGGGYPGYPGYPGYWPSNCYQYMSRVQGISGVLAVFHLLEFIVSITVAAYACYATCNCSEEQSSTFVVPENGLMIPNVQTPTVTQTHLPTVTEVLNFKDEHRAGQTEPPPYNV